MLKVLDLFSGIGGFSLGLERTGGFETVAFCEIEDYPRKVLSKHWPDVPIHKDVRELTSEQVGHVDLICGGYPCQPFSHAGKRQGAGDDRHLWPEVKRLMATIRPTWGLFENVAGHISMGLDEVLSDLESEGYAAWTVVIPACAVDAPHRRDRVWIVAHRQGEFSNGRKNGEHGRQGIQSEAGAGGCILANTGRQPEGRSFFGPSGKPINGQATGERATQGNGFTDGSETMAYSRRSDAQRQRKVSIGIEEKQRDFSDGRQWKSEPPVGRVAYGVSRRVDRLKGLGNAVVPQVVTQLGYAILEAEKGK